MFKVVRTLEEEKKSFDYLKQFTRETLFGQRDYGYGVSRNDFLRIVKFDTVYESVKKLFGKETVHKLREGVGDHYEKLSTNIFAWNIEFSNGKFALLELHVHSIDYTHSWHLMYRGDNNTKNQILDRLDFLKSTALFKERVITRRLDEAAGRPFYEPGIVGKIMSYAYSKK